MTANRIKKNDLDEMFYYQENIRSKKTFRTNNFFGNSDTILALNVKKMDILKIGDSEDQIRRINERARVKQISFNETALSKFLKTALRTFYIFIRYIYKIFGKKDKNLEIKIQTLVSTGSLWPMHNINKISDSDLYLYKAPMPKVSKNNILKSNYPFYHKKGACLGTSFWYIYLYFKTKESFKGKAPEEHLIALAKEFEDGCPKEGIFLQTLQEDDKILDLLKMKSTYRKDTIQNFEISDLANLLDGVYAVTLDCNQTFSHEVVFFKFSKKQLYIVDPNYGPIKMNLKRSFQDYIKRYDKPLQAKKPLISLTRIEPLKEG